MMPLVSLPFLVSSRNAPPPVEERCVTRQKTAERETMIDSVGDDDSSDVIQMPVRGQMPHGSQVMFGVNVTDATVIFWPGRK